MTAYLPPNPDLRLSAGWESQLNDLWVVYEGRPPLDSVYNIILDHCRDKDGNLRTL